MIDDLNEQIPVITERSILKTIDIKSGGIMAAQAPFGGLMEEVPDERRVAFIPEVHTPQ